MSSRGLRVIKPGVKNATRPRDYFMNSDNVLLKIHKQGAFSCLLLFGGGGVTIGFPELGYRPLVLVYVQRVNHDGNVDTNYHLLEWSYFGASQIGYGKVDIYNDHIDISISDGDMTMPRFATVYGYYYIFKEEIGK